MKHILQVISIAILPLLGGSPIQAQDDAAPPAAATVKGSSGAGGSGGSSYAQAAQAFDKTFGTVDRLQRIVTRGPGSGKPLVLRSSAMEPKDQAELEEDLAVMGHILDKILDALPAKSHVHTAMGIDVFAGSGASAMRDFYLEGYGAVFTINVGFPLLPPPPKAEPKNEGAEADPAWEEARQELYGQPGGNGPRAGETYNEEKVKDLKDRLLDSLKSAVNIRHLKSQDFLTVCVFGGTSGGGVGSKAVAKASSGARTGTEPFSTWIVTDHRAGQRGTIMTIRAKKADIDAYAKGDLDSEQFRKRVQLETYAGGEVGNGPAVFGFGGAGGGGFGGGGLGGGGF